MKLRTPIYDLKQFPEVYEPSEDTFLFLDALQADHQFLSNLNPRLAVEVGSGSGVLITALSQIFKTSCTYLATDINPQACRATKYTADLNLLPIECLNMNLLCGFRQNSFDIIMFNPPYVLTESDEIYGNGLNCAWRGGKNGRVITDKLLYRLPMLLDERGVCYMILLRENNPDEVENIMKSLNFISEIVIQRKIPGEQLYVYKFVRENIKI